MTKTFYPFITALILYLAIFISGCSSGSSNCNQSFGGTPSAAPNPTPNPTPQIYKDVRIDASYLDGVGISNAQIICDNPLFPANAFTDENGRFSFNADDIPDGTSFTLTFYKTNHIIETITFTIGQNGTQEGNTTHYFAQTLGWVPTNIDDWDEGRTSDFFAEDVGIYNVPNDLVFSPDRKTMYVADNRNNRIRVVNMDTGYISTLSGGPTSDYINGSATDSRFYTPWSMTISPNGKTIYLVDRGNNCIRTIDTATGESGLLAGTPKQTGNVYDCSFTDAKFCIYGGMLGINDAGTALYYGDEVQGVKKLDLTTQQVSLVVNNNVNGLSGSFYGMAVDSQPEGDILYFAAYNIHKIYKANLANGTVISIAGTTQGTQNGPGITAKFNLPNNVVISPDKQSLYVTENTSQIRKIDLSSPDFNVTTVAGSTAGYQEGIGEGSKFAGVMGMRVSDDNKTLYVCDRLNNRIRTIDLATGQTAKLSGGGRAGFYDGSKGDSSVSYNSNIYGICVSMDSDTIYFSDALSIYRTKLSERKIEKLGSSCAAQVANQYDVIYSKQYRGQANKIVLSQDEKTIFIADSYSHMIRALDIETKTESVIAGQLLTSGLVNAANGTDSRFNLPDGLALSQDGLSLYVSDSNNHRIRKVEIATGATTTFAGSGAGFADNCPATTSKFNLPTDVCFSPDFAYLYIADSYNHRIRRIDMSSFTVTTFAGTGTAGPSATPIQTQDGTLITAIFDEPRGLCIFPDGSYMLVTDKRASNIRKINMTSGDVKTINGGVHIGYQEGIGPNAFLYWPEAIAVFPDYSCILMADSGNSMLRVILKN